MQVSDAIKNSKHFVITRNGNILGINNGDGLKLRKHLMETEIEVLGFEVLKVQKVNGLYKDYDCIRV